ncbi:CHAT domain-containing protein [Candidatus Magnetobacterium casense]|uniref:CHAT domain-containing protein n=1 Tax=Candidatus Magnetobacterium casense TaxID=1455061 RepID=A0ABS6S242_9BACT|nr:CHAT domain-containing protein [Candidatus Magnetobacterium casensis]MBV6342905.1 CHAT domain-containing protein [Candidatus Magnetobacterium casensis]
MDNNNISITMTISSAANGSHAVHINNEPPYHIKEADVAALLTETRKNSWRTDHNAGAKLGRQLYDLLNRDAKLQGIFDAARDANKHATLYLQTTYDLTQLPFELLNNGGWLLLEHDIHIIRLVEDRGKSAQVAPKQEPLTMLFMACSPTDLDAKYVLGFEQEEERIFSSTGNYNIDMRVEDTGSLAGLKQTNILGGGFDIIHITGHAGFDEEKGPVFCMEDEVGRLHEVSPDNLWDAIKSHPPRLLFLSGCSTGGAHEETNSESFAYRMAQKGIQWVIGWGLLVSDTRATQVAAEMYGCLSGGSGLDRALKIARQSFEGQYNPWPLLRLFGDATPVVPLVAAGLPVKPVKHVKLKHKTLKDSNVRVLERGFVGRRRHVQQGVGVLRGATDKFGLLVRGTAGIGKSCLVGKLVDRFADKKELLVFHGVISEADVIVKLKKLLDKLGNEDGLAILTSDSSYEKKIKALFRTVFKNETPTIIYFDDFEQNLDRNGNQYCVKKELEGIIRPFLEVLDWAEGNSNVVISSRYPFILECDGENLPAIKLFDIALMSFNGADLDKKTRELYSIARSKHTDMYLKYGGGNPRLLEWLDVIARDEDKYRLYEIKERLQDKQAEFIHDYGFAVSGFLFTQE